MPTKEAVYDDPATQTAIRTTMAASLREAQQRVENEPNTVLCAVCQGDFVRLGGKLYCGYCGCPAEKGRPIMAPLAPIRNPVDLLKEEVAHLREENAAQQAWIAALEAEDEEKDAAEEDSDVDT